MNYSEPIIDKKIIILNETFQTKKKLYFLKITPSDPKILYAF